MSANLQEKMNIYLANQQLSFLKLHNLHWYVKGKGFFTLHAKLEEFYDETAKIIDEVAERLLALGGTPIANMKGALAAATIKELEDVPTSSEDTVSALVSDVEFWIRDTEELIKLSEDGGDVVTADIFTGYLNEYQKLLWMLKAYLA